MTYRLIYRSNAAHGVTDSDYRTIAMFSAMNNKALDITGLLLTCGKEIMQVLEGPEDAVEGLYAKIEKDPRHENVRKVFGETVDGREFTEWSMGFRPVDHPYELDMFFALTKQSLSEKLDTIDAPEVKASAQEFGHSADLD